MEHVIFWDWVIFPNICWNLFSPRDLYPRLSEMLFCPTMVTLEQTKKSLGPGVHTAPRTVYLPLLLRGNAVTSRWTIEMGGGIMARFIDEIIFIFWFCLILSHVHLLHLFIVYVHLLKSYYGGWNLTCIVMLGSLSNIVRFPASYELKILRWLNWVEKLIILFIKSIYCNISDRSHK